MAFDIFDLRSFYASGLGQTARAIVSARIATRWTSCIGQSVLGLGYAPPYLDPIHGQALRALAFMPAAMGVVNWPNEGLSATALVDTDALPLPDSSIDRVLLVHCLEIAQHPGNLLEEIWRVLTPGGRMIVIVPSRSGLWVRSERTPFGQGQPFSRSQLRDLLRETLFSPIYWGEALYLPPFERQILLKSARTFERIGSILSLPFAGVHVVEATKQLYRPILTRNPARFSLRSAQNALPDYAGNGQRLKTATLAGCATQYEPKTSSGGYSEVQLNADTFQISVEGNGFTSRDRARNIALLRAADLTLNSGYSRFIIVEKSLSMDTVGKDDTDIYKFNGMTFITGGEPIRKPDGLPKTPTLPPPMMPS
eukprot:gene7611-7674_t